MSTSQQLVWTVIVAGIVVYVLLKARLARYQPPAVLTPKPELEPEPDVEATPADGDSYAASMKLCSACKFFELKAAQEAMHRNPAFVRVMQTISPHENGAKTVTRVEKPCPACVDKPQDEGCDVCGGHREIVHYEKQYSDIIPPHATWDEFGWCTNEFVDKGKGGARGIMWGGLSNCGGKLFSVRRKTAPPLKLVG